MDVNAGRGICAGGASGPRGIGVDGCRGGWICVVFQAPGADKAAQTPARSAVYPDIAALWADLKPVSGLDRVLIDMPIGLPEGPEGANNRIVDRLCDRDCRRLLPAPRKSSVFPVPVRQALRAGDPSAVNAAVVGRRLSRQTINLIPKIRELDDFVASLLEAGLSGPALPAECHPELSFQRLNGNTAPPHKKKEAEGAAERIDILNRAGIPRGELLRLLEDLPRGTAVRDDLLDAAALAICAYRIAAGVSLPAYVSEGERQYDYEGRLEMNIVYC
ncbi:DUF429 domain-containing protein [Saccharibacillus sp. CPCC 101409]|uniref:DUF429 domain-containing protein n=1 Tax=Saccharibacillus sp. CPCC 101409 TaxID=3058041 RepID=UPI0026719254|nr:DUF429 domain-containing protein [Saccharibacillus sp. CPCC 101409]MDO3410466.1 DUF429 domain-containing protein [Saccharibacillus sp. CPCC 101409]